MNKLKIYISLLVVMLFIGACNPKIKNGALILSVTNNPQKYFLEQIAGDKYTISNVIPAGANPESMDLSPSQLIQLSHSIAYFKIGYLEIENILVNKVKESNPNIKIFECSDGINIIKEEHVHEHEGHDHSHADGDPHVWSSPQTAKQIAENMYKGLISLDAQNTSSYKANYDILIQSINETDSIIKSYLAKSESKSFIIYHPALSYFAKEYGLTQYAIEQDGKTPSPTQLKQLIDVAKEKKINVVFIQQEYDTKNAETIAKAIGAKTIPIDLLAYDWNSEMIKIAQHIASDE